MPHYKDGTPARVGDRVRGRGYNLKGEIEGYVLRVFPGAETCNVSVGTTHVSFDRNPDIGQDGGTRTEYATIEMGQADAFEKMSG